MSATHGSKAVLKINGGDFSAYLTDAGWTRSVDTAEASHLGDTEKEYVAGLGDGNIPLSGDFDVTADGILAGIGQDFATVAYFPTGEGTGHVSYSASFLLTKYDISTGVGDVGKFTAEFQKSGAVDREVA